MVKATGVTGPIDPLVFRNFKLEVPEKLPQGGTGRNGRKTRERSLFLFQLVLLGAQPSLLRSVVVAFKSRFFRSG